MKQSEFAEWLANTGYESGTIASRVANCLRIEEYEGDLDYHYANDGMDGLLKRLRYTIADKKMMRDALHSIPINGDVYNGTATLRAAVNLYMKFLSGEKDKTNNLSTSKATIKQFAKNEKQGLDSYERFLSTFNISKEKLYEFGLNETILPDIKEVDNYWAALKERVFSGGVVYIRGAGREAKGTQIYLEFYSALFGNNKITKDPTNNFRPQQILQIITGYKRNDNIFNYQVSHTFGKTKNPLLFEAPWNLAFVPKIIDPLTGHETQGAWPEEYQELYTGMIRKRYKKYIDDYNAIISGYEVEEKLNGFIQSISNSQYTDKQVQEFIKGVKNELSLI